MKRKHSASMSNSVRRAIVVLAVAGAASESHAQRGSTTAPPPPPVTTAPQETVKLFNLETATLPEMQEAMATGALTSVELVTMFLRRIQAYDKASAVSPNLPLNSVAEINPELLEDAAQADRLRKQGIFLGPFHGIPFLVKWSFPIQDMALTGGTNGWRNLIVPNETWVVSKLRAGGAIVMGHANMDTWASSAANSSSQLRGAVRSCYLNNALPGGSSGGSGVSSGAYLTAFAFGGETGGSIRNPGDRSALIAYKPSGGSIAVNGIIPLVPERDVIGPMTRSVIDNAYVRDAVGEVDPEDLWAPAVEILSDKRPVPESGFVEAAKNATLVGKKIGIIGTYVGMSHPNPGPGATSNTTGVNNNSALTTTLVQKAKADMEALGATVEYVFMPPPVSTTYNRGPGAPALRLNATPFSNQVAAYVYRSVIESAVDYPGDTYSERAAKVIATASLVTNISAARRNMMYTLQDGVYYPGEAISFASEAGIEHYEARCEQKNAFEDWMDAEGLDAVVWPNWPNKTASGGTIIARDLVNFMFLPSVTVPMGVLNYSATNREPLTINFCGRLFDDVNVLAIARAYEQGTKHRYNPPLAPPLAGEVFAFNRQTVKTPNRERVPPVLTVSSEGSVVGENPERVITFTGNLADASGIARLEVTAGGVRLPSTISGTTWTSVLSTTATTAAFLRNATSLELIVLAVDEAGNATTKVETVTFEDPEV